MANPTPETAAQRFARDWASVEADRKTRGLDQQPHERLDRLYVNDANGDSATY